MIAVWYPNRTAFLAMESFPGYRPAFELHRRAAVEHAALIFCAAGDKPELTTPFEV